MTKNENKKIFKKVIEALNRHDLDDVFSHYADYAIIIGASGTIMDKEHTKKLFAKTFSEYFPDMRFRLERMASKANVVWAELIVTGTHKGEYHGIPATDKIFEYTMVVICDFEADKIKTWKTVWNILELEKQLRE